MTLAIDRADQDTFVVECGNKVLRERNNNVGLWKAVALPATSQQGQTQSGAMRGREGIRQIECLKLGCILRRCKLIVNLAPSGRSVEDARPEDFGEDVGGKPEQNQT